MSQRWRLFLVLTVALLGLGALVSSGVQLAGIERERSRQSVTQEAKAEIRVRQIRAFVASHVSLLASTAESPSIRHLIEGRPLPADELSGLFLALIRHHPALLQVRLIGPSGWELVRVDRRAEGLVVIGLDDLQNKTDRPYFFKTIALKAGEIFISPLDLNIEHKTIEVPWVPTLRIATPVSFPLLGKNGILVFNLAAQTILDISDTEKTTSNEQRSLLNAEGYWLTGVPKEKRWGFLFNQDATLAKEDPTLWEHLNSCQGGFLHRDHAFIYHQRIDLTQALAEAGTDTESIIAQAPVWFEVISSPVPSFFGDGGGLLALVGLGGPGCALVAWAWSGSIVRQRNAVAQRLRAEQHLVQAQKLAALGELVAGIAHELNTPLGNAVTFISTLCERMHLFRAATSGGRISRAALDTLTDDIDKGLHDAERCLERAAHLIKRFKEIAVDQTGERARTFTLDDYVLELIDTMRPQFKSTPYELDVHLGSSVYMDSYPGPLGQVIVNLITNALLHGLAGRPSGTITVSTERGQAGQVRIIVADNGAGMPAAIRNRIFEPFFTTKPGAGGSGLGLSIVHSIVTNLLGGQLEVESEEGTGTTITVVVPVVAPQRLAPSPDAAASSAPQRSPA
ncbi:hypothetical protein ROR02_23740 [Pararhodospirillum oryzae]|uniref:histidine kinase n=1 Tax=Pararhodospirillum oryzae TaxID=478448 RepID=A0A512H9W6_9PROT|nr:hypothetical protein ROR02_23740 [Pararhodospirillum oryzae]